MYGISTRGAYTALIAGENVLAILPTSFRDSLKYHVFDKFLAKIVIGPKIVTGLYDLHKSCRFLETISLLENLGIKRKRDKCRLGDSKYGLNISYINMKDRVTLVNKVESKLEALKKLSSQLVTISQTKTSRTTHRHTQEKKHNQASHSPLF